MLKIPAILTRCYVVQGAYRAVELMTHLSITMLHLIMSAYAFSIIPLFLIICMLQIVILSRKFLYNNKSNCWRNLKAKSLSN
jgi:hypothetical protein